MSESVFMDLGAFESQIDIKAANLLKEMHGNRPERIWTKSPNPFWWMLVILGHTLAPKQEIH